MELVLPSIQYKESYIEAVKEFQEDHTFPLMERKYDRLSIQELDAHFDVYVENENRKARGENLPLGWVPATTYWLIDNGTYIGRASVRHRLTEQLEKWGGHIGYDIRPSMRGKGYGTTILKLALGEAQKLGIEHVFLTCDATNTASRKIIEKNGGVYQDRIPYPATGVDKLRYWIHVD